MQRDQLRRMPGLADGTLDPLNSRGEDCLPGRKLQKNCYDFYALVTKSSRELCVILAVSSQNFRLVAMQITRIHRDLFWRTEGLSFSASKVGRTELGAFN